MIWALPLSLEYFGVQFHHSSLQGLLERLAAVSAVKYPWKYMPLMQHGRGGAQLRRRDQLLLLFYKMCKVHSCTS